METLNGKNPQGLVSGEVGGIDLPRVTREQIAPGTLVKCLRQNTIIAGPSYSFAVVSEVRDWYGEPMYLVGPQYPTPLVAAKSATSVFYTGV